MFVAKKVPENMISSAAFCKMRGSATEAWLAPTIYALADGVIDATVWILKGKAGDEGRRRIRGAGPARHAGGIEKGHLLDRVRSHRRPRLY